METYAQKRLRDNPFVKVVRWTVPWILIAVVGWYLWGFYTEFRVNSRVVRRPLSDCQYPGCQTGTEKCAFALGHRKRVALEPGLGFR